MSRAFILRHGSETPVCGCARDDAPLRTGIWEQEV